MSGIEGLGEAVTGGMLARAVEPSAGEAVHGHSQTCLNCGTALTGEYCHHCGQPAHIHRSLHAFFHDLLHSVLHFEGKTWRTLPMLAFKPGELTRRYIAGERARFVSPMGLFLFSVFLMFAVFGLVGGPMGNSNVNQRVQADIAKDLRDQVVENRIAVEKAERRLAEAKAEGQPLARREERLAEARTELQVSEQAAKLATAAAAAEAKDKAVAKGKQSDESLVREFGNGDISLESGVQQFEANTGFSPLDSAIEKLKGNPSLALYKLQSNAYKFSWALIPLSVPLVWSLFFWKRQFKLYDHTVFVTYSIAAMSLGLIILSILRPLGFPGDLAELAMIVLPPIHMYKQLKGAYGLSRRSALWRTFMLIVFAFVATGWFFAMLFGIGVLG